MKIVNLPVILNGFNMVTKPAKEYTDSQGDRIWIDDPIFQGIEARFEQCINGEDRVVVLLSLLKWQTVRVQIDADKVRRAL